MIGRESALSRVAIAVCVLTVASCTNGGPAAPWSLDLAAPAMSGTWNGLLEFTSCTGRNRCGGSGIRDFTLTLAPDGAGLVGFLVFEDEARRYFSIGSATIDPAPVFTAASPVVDGYYPERTTIHRFVLQEDAAYGLTGSFEYTVDTYSDGAILSSTRRRVAIRSGVRAPGGAQRPGNFHGRWEGYYATRSCRGECEVGGGGYNYPPGGNISLELSQSGATIAGRLNHVPITGTASADALSAAGAPVPSEGCATCWDCEGVCGYWVTRLDARTDKMGRLTGSLEYVLKGWTGREHFTQTLQLDLIGVTRVQ